MVQDRDMVAVEV